MDGRCDYLDAVPNQGRPRSLKRDTQDHGSDYMLDSRPIGSERTCSREQRSSATTGVMNAIRLATRKKEKGFDNGRINNPADDSVKNDGHGCEEAMKNRHVHFPLMR